MIEEDAEEEMAQEDVNQDVEDVNQDTSIEDLANLEELLESDDELF